MTPWKTLDRVPTPDGELVLRRRGAEYVITLDGRVLMTSAASGSEAWLGRAVAKVASAGAGRRVLVGGLGMGVTLRAALDALPSEAIVDVVELNPVVVEWCRGPLAVVSATALADRRVRVHVADVATHLRAAADGSPADRYAGIALDLYEGVAPSGSAGTDPFYGRRALARTHAALVDGGVFGRWTEQPDAPFAARLRDAGFDVRAERAGTHGRWHTVYLGLRRPGVRGKTPTRSPASAPAPASR